MDQGFYFKKTCKTGKLQSVKTINKQYINYLEPSCLRLVSRSTSVCAKKRHRLTPVRLSLTNQGSSTNTGRSSLFWEKESKEKKVMFWFQLQNKLYDHLNSPFYIKKFLGFRLNKLWSTKSLRFLYGSP